MRLKLGNADRVVSISAIFIIVATLIVLIFQTNIMREQQRLSVLPYLMISNQYIGTPNYKLVLKNDGIGPAFIESIKVFYEGKIYEKDFARFMTDEIPEFDSLTNVYYSNIGQWQLIPAGETINIFEVNQSIVDSNKLYELIGKLIQKDSLDFQIVYSSIYNEKWRISAYVNRPEKIE